MSEWTTPEEARLGILHGNGQGIRIAVLDSGIETTHPAFERVEFSDNLTFVAGNPNSICEENTNGDGYGHGTAVAAAILRTAPKVTLGSFRVLGGLAYKREYLISLGAKLALDRGYHILHCSFGAVGSPLTVMSFKDWIDDAFVTGVHVVAACNGQNHRYRVWPAHFPSVMSVDSVPSTRIDALYVRKTSLVEFAAKGKEKILLPWSGRSQRLVEGTSFSASILTGLLARLLSVYPGLRPESAKALLKAIAEPLPDEI